MERRTLATTALSAALGLLLAAQGAPVGAQEKKDDKAAASMEKCYGINAVAKNDCAAGAHSCAGQATKARDGQSFVLLPAGACSKISGGKTTPA